MNEMNDRTVEIWKNLIESGKLREASTFIQMGTCCVQNKNKFNENICKLLLYLCRTADKCRTAEKPNSETGKDIAELTKLLCSLLTNVPDGNKFIKILFKIIHCTISLNLYEDAAKICYYLQPGNLYSPQDDTMNQLTKVLSLWYIFANNVYFARNKSLNAEEFNDLKSIIKYEIKVTQIICKNYTKQLITRISTYFDKMTTVDKENKYFDNFCKHILECLKETQLYLAKDEKYVIYDRILCIMSHVICRTIDKMNIGCTVKMSNELFNYFNVLLTEDEECYECFQQLQKFCTTLLVPIENLMSNSAKNMQDIISCQSDIARKYGYTGGLKGNAFIIAEIIEPMFKYWEICIESDEHVLKQLLDTGVLLEVMNFILQIDADEFYNKKASIECKWCQNKMCIVKRDLYNAIIMKYKCISLLCKYRVKDMPKKVCVIARETLKQNVKWITCEMKKCKCKRWIHLWTICRTLIYNTSILSEHDYEESTSLYSFLCASIFEFQKLEPNSEDVKNIVPLALHKLSVMHYNNNMYSEAMTASALYALLTYESNMKAFLIWTSIKKRVSEKYKQLTMLDCLKNDRCKIKSDISLSIDLSKYDLVKLCLYEAKSLLEGRISFTDGVSAVVDKIKNLKPSICQYAHVIQLLGHYLLIFEYDSSILKYHEQVISALKQNKLNSVAHLCLEANFNFFIFVEELHAMNKQTQLEMENTKFALCAPKIPELVEVKSPNIVPAYTMINVKKASSLVLNLQKCLKIWKQLFDYDINEIVKNWEPTLVLRILITAGEYSRLYRYEDCEAEAWTLAYKLATEIDDYCSIIYVTGRCISLRHINYDWIAIAKEYAVKHKDSEDKNVTAAIAMFWISLADLYFECRKCDDAKQLLTEARSLPGITFFDSTAVYLLILNVIICNSSLYNDNMQHEEYGSYIVNGLLTSRYLNQDLLVKKCKSQANYLFSYDVIFTTAVNLSMRVNSLLSFRGISPDLVQHLKSAQSLGAVLRVAELLKSLCYIDLSRSQLNDCEVKLQGLEHMLAIETFQSSMNVKTEKHTSSAFHLAVTPTKNVDDPVRDIPQLSASPVLGRQIFDLPTFTLHKNCDCYMCHNVSYQYLVFVTTYIRAQLYTLQNQVTIALDHFYGAFEIRQKLFKEEKSALFENWPDDEMSVKRFSWQTRFYIIDYVYLLIDFNYFLKTNVIPRQHDALDIANLAIDLGHKYKLEGHPVYISARELLMDNDFQPLESSGCSKFIVPQPYNIDVSSYAEVLTNSNVCVTPSVQNRAKKPLSIRRKKTPRALKITKINMIWSDDEDDDSLSPPLITRSTRKFKLQDTKLTRKNLEKDLSDDVNPTKDSALKKTKSKHDLNENEDGTQRKLMKDIMSEISPLVPDISQKLMVLLDKSDEPATMENIDKLIEKVENLKINSTTTSRRKTFNDKTKLTAVDYNKNVNRAIELLKNLEINKKTDENIHLFTPTKVDKQIQDQKTPQHEKKFFKLGLLKQHLENEKLNKMLNTRTTRSSIRKTKEKGL